MAPDSIPDPGNNHLVRRHVLFVDGGNAELGVAAESKEMSDVLLELARQCENAKWSDRQLDARIFIAITPGVAEARRIDQIDGVVGWWPTAEPYQSAREVPRYTGSLDAAMTLFIRKPETISTNPLIACAQAMRERAQQ